MKFLLKLIQSRDELDITAGRGVAVREFQMKAGFGFADYLLYLGTAEAHRRRARGAGPRGQSSEASRKASAASHAEQLKGMRSTAIVQAKGYRHRVTAIEAASRLMVGRASLAVNQALVIRNCAP